MTKGKTWGVGEPLITKEAWIAATKPPIVASYMDAYGAWVLTEPRHYEWVEDGMILYFRFHHSGPTITTSKVVLEIGDVASVYDPTPHETLRSGQAFDVVILLPYE